MNEHIQELEVAQMLQPNKLYATDCGDYILYEYYLVGNIGDPENYLDLCHALRSATPDDEFILRINSGGGQVRTGNQIINALEESPATTIGYIEHECGSMATFIFLACKKWDVSRYAEWFSHTVSGGNAGKEHETFAASLFLRKQTHKRIREEYKGFLSDEEIEELLKGGDIYLDADEVTERLEEYVKLRREGKETEYTPPMTITDMVEVAVTKAFEKQQKAVNIFNNGPFLGGNLDAGEHLIGNPVMAYAQSAGNEESPLVDFDNDK